VDILEIEDVLKGLPDQALRQEAQQPTGQVPQYMVVSEIQRRSKMRKSFEAQKQQPSGTVREQILQEGIASVAPPPAQMMGAMGMPQQPPAPPQQPPMGQQQPPMQPQQMPPQQPPMPQQGAPMPPPVQMQTGGKTVGGASIEDSIRTVLEDYGVPASVLKLDPKFSQYASLIDQISADMMSGVQVYDTAEQQANIPYGQEFGKYGMTREEFEAQRGPRIGDVKASDIYGDVSLPSLPDMPMVGTTPELQRQRAREELDPVSPMSTTISPLGTYGSTAEEFDAVRGSLGVDKASSAFAKTFGEMTQESLDEAAPNRQFIADLLSGKFAYEPESVARAKRGESLFPPTQQTATAQPQLSVPEDPFGMLRSDAVGLSPLRSQQNILQETISDMALVGDQPVVTDVASSSAVTNDAQTGAVAPESTGTKVTRETIEAATSDVTPEFKVGQDIAKDFSNLVAPSFAGLISEQERRLAKIREDAKRDVGAQALINLGAGIAEGDVSGGLVRAGEAASKVRAAERAAESDIATMQARIKMAEEQGKFDVAKALRAEQVQLYRDATKAAEGESQFVRTLGLSKQKLLAEVEKEAGVDARAKLSAAISIMEQELNPEKKQRMIERIARQYLPLLGQGVIANDQSGQTQGNQNRPPLSSFGG
jgi:hypothetical protein